MASTPTYQTPVVLTRHDGVPVDVQQYDDRVVMHDPKRYQERARGSRSVCGNRLCEQKAILDRRVAGGIAGAWRPLCVQHSYSLVGKVSPSLGKFVVQMIRAAEDTD